MLKLFTLFIFLSVGMFTYAETIFVKNAAELATANRNAKPGDCILLQNGIWNDVRLVLSCHGIKTQPIIFKAQTPGKVLITGNSSLSIGGEYIVVDGLYFTKGFAGNTEVIKFCIDKNTIANNCRVTNTTISDFNNPKRLDENYWVALYGKNNRIDHCSFVNKKNMGVLLAVMLDDERSRENFHQIDSNYFGVRLPLASNTGEIIRVGVSQHCEFNSNTLILNNFFEHCNGETEIISIKSGNNIIRNNLFKECEGSVVLRHGNFNTVENNIFLGNHKPGTGGVRIINKGQWVVNNLFYQCRGDGFRSPLSIMNGVPNSPAHRYVAVTDAVISNNSFIDCSPISFCEGSDAERSVWPQNVWFGNNIFYSANSSVLYNLHDTTSGINFVNNIANNTITHPLLQGFTTKNIRTFRSGAFLIPTVETKEPQSDSLQAIAIKRLSKKLPQEPGFRSFQLLQTTVTNAALLYGAKWFTAKKNSPNYQKEVVCKNAEEVITQLSAKLNTNLKINLTGATYHFSSPLIITRNVTFASSSKKRIHFSFAPAGTDFLILIEAGNTLAFSNIHLNTKAVHTNTFIRTDTSGSCHHSSFIMQHCSIIYLNNNFFKASKSAVMDSLVFKNVSFINLSGTILSLDAETDKKGYYNVEQLKITNCSFTNNKGQLLNILRGGTDESTMGPRLYFINNSVNNCTTQTEESLLSLNGVQYSYTQKNRFLNSNTDKVIVQFEDAVKAKHYFTENTLINCGRISGNQFLSIKNNSILK
jgi:poly(beta-D-mannuronate) lyase